MSPSHLPRLAVSTLLFALLGHAACTETASQEPASTQTPCTGKCDGAGEQDFHASLEGRDEPVAQYLGAVASSKGKLAGDYRSFLDGVGASMGCAPESERTFVILLSNKDYFPRNIVTLCSDSPRKANQLFVSTQSDQGELGDVDGHNFKVAAWDGEAERYNLYEISQRGEDAEMTVEVEPAKCATCHSAPADLPVAGEVFAPIMNELTNPWTLWNAEPQFRSHRFEDLLPAALAQAPIYNAMTREETLGGAADFETITRAALDRVAKARLDLRKEAASLTGSLRLLQPLFCEEVINYASENHGTNQIQADALVDASIRDMFVELDGYSWQQDFIHQDRHRFQDPTSSQARLEVIPVRGAYSVSMDRALVSRRVLTAQQVLRLRALDWQRPVFSEFRCNLFTHGVERLRLDGFESSAYETNAELAPVLFEEIMKLDGELALIPSEDASVISAPRVTDELLERWRTQGTQAEQLSHDAFATQVDDYLDALTTPGARARLEDERQRRGCLARSRFASAPEIPNLSCETR